MKTRRTFWLSLGGVAFLSVLILACLLNTGQITPHMLTDFGYFRWAHGMAPIQPSYMFVFERDYRLQQRFVGQPIAVLRPLFPELQAGADYAPTSYRATNVKACFSHYPGSRFEDYWLEGTQQEFGFCVLVIDGKIRDFNFVKG